MGFTRPDKKIMGTCYICGNEVTERASINVYGKWAHVWHIKAYHFSERPNQEDTPNA